LEEKLKARAKELGLSDRCHFTGFRTDLPEIYASLDALALTSDNEGTPVAVIEALAAGVPVVATGVGGVRDVFSTAGTGTLVPPGNADALAEALSNLLASPPPPAAREEARQKVLAHYSEKRLCRDLAALYEELLGISGKEKATVIK
ncbi:MAG: glycosyltransferase, partial [Bdellovibrionota bacterium]